MSAKPPGRRKALPTETEMKSTKATRSTEAAGREAQNLEVRYGKIGISAVVAAMRYRSDARPPEPTSIAHRPDKRPPQPLPEFAA